MSEELDESAVQALIDTAIADIFPKPCGKLRAANQSIRTRSKEELGKRNDVVRQEIARGGASLRRTLREVVVEDVLRLFPYVLVDDVVGNTAITFASADRWNMTAFPCFISLEAVTIVSMVMVIYPMMAICLSAEIPFFYSKGSTCTYNKLAGGSQLTALTPLTPLVYSSLIG